jgi:hypothetical protein
MAVSVDQARQIERGLIREAIATRTIERRLGDELIAAGRDVVAAWHERRNSEDRLAKAVAHLEKLVGKP